MDDPILPSRDYVTVSQVAGVTGVSKASVSRYTGDGHQLLVDATARCIKRTIDQLDYRPNQTTRGLKRGRTRLVGTLVVNILNPYSAAAMHGVETACHEHGYNLVMCNTDHNNEQKRHHLTTLQSYSVEGLIVNTLGYHPGELRALYRELPMVPVDHQLVGLDTDLIGLDSTDAVEQALGHPQQRGFRNILLITEPLDGASSRIGQAQAFDISIDRQPVLKGQVLQTDDFFHDGLRAFLSANGPGPKALFTCSDVATLCAIRRSRGLSCRLFDRVSLPAPNKLDWYSLVGSGITAFVQLIGGIGHTAFERLLAQLEGDREPACRVTFLAQLVVRGLTYPRD